MEATAQESGARGRTVTARLPLWVLIGAFLGILAGITFGERTAVLRVCPKTSGGITKFSEHEAD